MKTIQLCIALIICCADLTVASSFYPLPPAPVITSSKGATLCNGDNTVLTATSAGATHYLWSTGATTKSITVTATGTYTATASNATGNSAPGQIIISPTSFGLYSIQWQKCLGGIGHEYANSIQQTYDGGYIVAGHTTGPDNGDVSGYHGGNFDYWIVKLDSTGIIQWQKCLGGSDNDYGNSIQQTSDSGYIVAGLTASNDGDVTGNHGGYDYWIVKLNNSGIIQWQKCLGGSLEDNANSIQQTSDGGFIVAGYSFSNNGDVSGNHINTYYNNDYWIVKLSPDGSCPEPSSGFSVSDITATSARVHWDIIECAQLYKLRYRVTGTTTWQLPHLPTSRGYKLFPFLAPSTNYDWQVKTVCDSSLNNESKFSAIQHFTTAPLREANIYSISNCTVFPNPTKGNFTLSFISDDNLKGSIEIYNTIGGLVIHRSIEMTEGDNSMQLDLSTAPTGIYFLNIKTANGVYRQRLVKE